MKEFVEIFMVKEETKQGLNPIVRSGLF